MYKFFKGCIPQILLGPFLNTLSQIIFHLKEDNVANENIKLSQGKIDISFYHITFTCASGFSKGISRYEKRLCNCFGMHGSSKYSYPQMEPENVTKSYISRIKYAKYIFQKVLES